MRNEAAVISQGILFATTEHRVEMGKQAAAALEIATVWNALSFGIEKVTGWDLRLMAKKADMNRRDGQSWYAGVGWTETFESE